MPDEDWSQPDPNRLRAALSLLDLACEPGSAVADLGCLHGAYSIAFAQAGYKVLGIDARIRHIARCEANAGAAGSRARFACDDVRNIEQHGPFDAVWCCGLLYHLENPVAYLKTLARVTRRLLIVQTHYSLAGTDTNEGLPGSWYGEPPAGAEDIDNPWASWGNTRSFWLTKSALLLAIQDAGFGLVAELHDSYADINGSVDRGMFAAIRTH